MKFQNILVALNLKGNNTQIVKFSFELASRLNADLNFLHCFHPEVTDLGIHQDEIEEKHLNELCGIVEPISEIYSETNFNCEVKYAFPVDGVHHVLDDSNFDLLIIGSYKQSGGLLKTKNITESIVSKCNLPVILIPEHFRLVDFDSMVFNIEFEFCEIEKIFSLIDFSNQMSANLSCIHVSEKINSGRAQKNVKTYERIFLEAGRNTNLDFEIITKEKTNALEKFAIENEVDLVVVLKSRRTWKNIYLPSLEEELSQQLSIPILILDN